MHVRDYESIMLPLLKYAGNQKERSLSQAIDALAKQFKLTRYEKEEVDLAYYVKDSSYKGYHNGKSVFRHNVEKALKHMKTSKLLEGTRKDYFRITSRGAQVLQSNPEKIDEDFLSQFPEYQRFQKLAAQRLQRNKSIRMMLLKGLVIIMCSLACLLIIGFIWFVFKHLPAPMPLGKDESWTFERIIDQGYRSWWGLAAISTIGLLICLGYGLGGRKSAKESPSTSDPDEKKDPWEPLFRTIAAIALVAGLLAFSLLVGVYK
jgi:hypothetical protein